MSASKTGAAIAGWLSGMASVSVLGIPAGAFLAALVVAALDGASAESDGRHAHRLLGQIVLRALIGGWLAVMVVKLPVFAGYGTQEVGVTVSAALLTLCVPWVRANGARLASDTWAAILARFGGRKNHDDNR